MSPTGNLNISNSLPEVVAEWNHQHVMLFIKENLKKYPIGNKLIGKLEELDATGLGFVTLTEEKLQESGFYPPQAEAIMCLVDALRLTKIPKHEDHLTLEAEEYKAIRASIAITLPRKHRPEPEELDVILNKINLQPSCLRASEDLPEHAKLFVDRLNAQAPYTVDGDLGPAVALLRDCLGNEAFEEHFTINTIGTREPASLRELFSYFALMGQLQDRLQYHDEYTALAKEVCLSAFVVDQAINVLDEAYNRDKEHAYIELKQSSNALPDDVWVPKNDFRISFKKRGTGYALLHGETGFSGQTEEDAMYKNALLSLHSWRIMHEIYGFDDPVILYAYVSRSICSMYIFFKNNSDDQFIFKCILKELDMFYSIPKAVGFLRRFHNFAAYAKTHRDMSPPAVNKKGLRAMVDILTPSTSTRENDSNRGPGDSRSSKNACRHLSGGPAAPVPTMALAGLGYEVRRNPSQRSVLTLLKKANRSFAAKRVERSPELEILDHLRSVSSHHNHIIPIVDILLLDINLALIIMPFYTALDKVMDFTEEEYHDIEPQFAGAIAFLHQHGIVHCDIKPENVVIDFTTSARTLYVIDFDLARWHLSGALRLSGFIGTMDCTAPEIREGHTWDPMPADVWAMAKTLRSLAKRAGVQVSFLDPALSCKPALRPSAFEFLANILARSPKKRSASQPLEEDRNPKRVALETKDDGSAIGEPGPDSDDSSRAIDTDSRPSEMVTSKQQEGQ